MSTTLMPHPDRATLLRLLDDDLSGADQQMVHDHLGGCRACRSELKEVSDAAEEYLRFHLAVVKTALPAAPMPWSRLDVLAARVPAGHAHGRVRMFPSIQARWMAAAAAVAAVFAFIRLTQSTPEVKAAELLQKARSVEAMAPARPRSIRIKSQKFAWDRPARLAQSTVTTSADASGIRELLESAGYDWRDPLSATAYAGWRDRLSVKQDHVADDPARHVIRTTTQASLISDASLTLAADLHAVACTLRFGEDDLLEMSEFPEELGPLAGNGPRTATPADHPAPALPAPSAGPAEELQVIAALHRIGADLGEPVEVRREGGVVIVSVTGVNPRRQAELKTLLEGLPGVRLQFGEFRRGESRGTAGGAAAQVDSSNELLSELQAALPQSGTTAELADQLSESTENILIRAYALRGLARRFPQETATQLSAAEMAVLREIAIDHARSIEAPLAAIARLIRPLLPEVMSVDGGSEKTWQEMSLAMVPAARELDQSLNSSEAGDPARKLRLARAVAALTQRLSRLHTEIQP